MKDETKKPALSPMLVGALAVLLVGGIVVYAATNKGQVKQEENTPAADQALIEAEDDDEDENEEDTDVEIVEVQGGSFYFEPNEIEVEKGDTVKIKFKAMDAMHDFVIDDLNVRTKIVKSGEMDEVEFVASQEGEFEFYCSVGEHRANGMVGKLIVED